MKYNLDKQQLYRVTFAHFLDDTDVISDVVVTGRLFYRIRGQMHDMGYMVRDVREVERDATVCVSE